MYKPVIDHQQAPAFDGMICNYLLSQNFGDWQ
jgi:hypothetical protein